MTFSIIKYQIINNNLIVYKQERTVHLQISIKLINLIRSLSIVYVQYLYKSKYPSIYSNISAADIHSNTHIKSTIKCTKLQRCRINLHPPKLFTNVVSQVGAKKTPFLKRLSNRYFSRYLPNSFFVVLSNFLATISILYFVDRFI